MDTFFILAVLTGVLVGVILAAIVVLILHIRSNSQINRMTYPAYEYAIKKAEHDAQKIMEEAQKQARSVITHAEEVGQQSIRKYDEEAKAMHQRYQEAVSAQGAELSRRFDGLAEQETHKLHEVIGGMSQSLGDEHEKAMQNLNRMSTALETVSTKAETRISELMQSLEERMGGVSHGIEESLKQAETKGLREIESHFSALQGTVEKEVAAYGENRKKLLDAHIEELVEDVVKEVLSVALPVSAHASLARQALEEAKAKQIL